MPESVKQRAQTPYRGGRNKKGVEDTPEDRIRKERARLAQRDRRNRQKYEFETLRQKHVEYVHNEPRLKHQLHQLTFKTETALEQNEKLKKQVRVLMKQLRDLDQTNAVLLNHVEVWKSSWCDLLQRTSTMATPANKRSAAEAELDEFQQRRRPIYNPYFQQ